MAMKAEFRSLKAGRTIYLDSLYEFSFAHCLEYLPTVLKYEEAHKHRIKIPYVDDKNRNYIPDFYVEFEWMKCLFEVKPSSQLEWRRNQLKFTAGRKYCKERGWHFVIVTKEILKRGFELDNIMLLSGYTRYPITDREILDLQSVLNDLGGQTTLGALIAAMKLRDPGHARSIVLFAAFHHYIEIDISGSRIDDDSWIKSIWFGGAKWTP